MCTCSRQLCIGCNIYNLTHNVDGHPAQEVSKHDQRESARQGHVLLVGLLHMREALGLLIGSFDHPEQVGVRHEDKDEGHEVHAMKEGD